MTERLFVQLASIPVIGIFAQWLAWRLRLPSILLLLLIGFIAGPVTKMIHPDMIFGNKLGYLISISVAIILFEGGLNLNFSELKSIRSIVRNLISIGALLSATLISLAAHFILDLPIGLSILLGSILIVSGPTVINPIIKHIRLKRDIASILKWEGLLIDPVGATLSVIVFKILVLSGLNSVFGFALAQLFKAILFGSLFGMIGSVFLTKIIKKHLIPDFLQESITLALVLMIYTVSNICQIESGLLAVTVMGIFLANQKMVNIKPIINFKENLTLLLLSSLFIILSARIPLSTLVHYINIKMGLFLLVLLFIIRPLVIFLCTLKSHLTWREKVFLSLIAPRGIVAGAIASLFAIKLSKLGIIETNGLIEITFMVIIISIFFTGLLANLLATLLNVIQKRRLGVMILGIDDWTITIGKILQKHQIKIILVDNDKKKILNAKSQNLQTCHGSIASKQILNEIEKNGIGRLLALSQNDELNELAILKYKNILGPRVVYRLYNRNKTIEQIKEHQILFGKQYTHTYISTRLIAGAKIHEFAIKSDTDIKKLKQQSPKMIPLFILTKEKHLLVCTQHNKFKPKANEILVYLD